MWDTLIINPMTNALLLLYDFLGNNFVLAILVFTVIIRLVTLPLSLRQQRSSMRMQEMQPQVQAIQKKYKDNPAKMQEEFKKIGYNPTEMLTGCLPLLIQFPILIGMYRAIIVLLGSTPLSLFGLNDIIYPWTANLVDVASALPVSNQFLWLNLAQPDPLYVLPILIFVSMFVSQKYLTPSARRSKDKKADDPMSSMNQSMQITMPIMFAFFSLSFPAGLSIYWILSNLIGVGQGWFTRSSMEKEKAGRATAQAIGPTTGVPVAQTEPKVSAPAPSTVKRKRRSAKR
jgi:YidC/Oxa1 family membrane protein insertase